MKKASIKALLLISVLCLNMLLGSVPVFGSDSGVAIDGPYLIDMTENSVTIKWYSDVDAYAEVEYGTNGQFTNSIISTEDGFVKIGTDHEIQLTGLAAGTEYNYRIKTTEVIELRTYNPVIGDTVTSETYTFTTFDSSKDKTTFWYMTDTHANTTRMNKLLGIIDYDNCDFVVFGGDDFDNVASRDVVFNHFIRPVTNWYGAGIPSVCVHGNHDYWGLYSRELFKHLNTEGTDWYKAFNNGPAAFVVFDSGAMEPDSASRFSGLSRSSEYRAEQYVWLQEHTKTPEFADASAQIVFTHENFMGNMFYDHPPYYYDDWFELANGAGVDLMISGHLHQHNFIRPGEYGNDYYNLWVNQDEVVKVEVTAEDINITVFNINGNISNTYYIKLGYDIPETVTGSLLGDPIGKDQSNNALELGTVFKSSADGLVTAVRVFGALLDTGTEHTIRIWDNSTNEVVAGPYTFEYVGYWAWWTYYLPVPLEIKADTEYTVSVSTGEGDQLGYSFIDGFFTEAGDNGGYISWPANAGVYSTTLGERPTLNDGNGTHYMRDVIFYPNQSLGSMEYTLSFITHGGSPVAAIRAESGAKLIKPEEPVREGFDFAGWYKEADFVNPWDFDVDTMPAKDITLYAKWVKSPGDAVVEAESGTLIGTRPRRYGDPMLSGGYGISYMLDEGDAVVFSDFPQSNKLAIAYAIQWDAVMSLYINDSFAKVVNFPTNTTDYRAPYEELIVDVDIPKGATVKFQIDAGQTGVAMDYIMPSLETVTNKILEITTPDKISVAYGTNVWFLELPSQVEVTLEDGSKLNVDVEWNASTPVYDSFTPGEYTFTGILKNLPEGVVNSDNLIPSVIVEVEEEEAPVSAQFTLDGPDIVIAGETVDIKVKAAMDDLKGFDLRLQYDDELFELLDVTLDSEFGIQGESAYFDVNPGSGSVRAIGSLLGDGARSGETGLIVVTLKARGPDGAGAAALMAGSQLSDSSEALFTLEEDMQSSIVAANPDVAGNDGLVRINDLTKVAGLFMSESGDEGYIAQCDINKDGVIDIVDIVFIGRILLEKPMDD